MEVIPRECKWLDRKVLHKESTHCVSSEKSSCSGIFNNLICNSQEPQRSLNTSAGVRLSLWPMNSCNLHVSWCMFRVNVCNALTQGSREEHTAASQLEPGDGIAASELNLAFIWVLGLFLLHTFVVSALWISCHCCSTCCSEWGSSRAAWKCLYLWLYLWLEWYLLLWGLTASYKGVGYHQENKVRKEKKFIVPLCDSDFPVVLPSVTGDKSLFWHFPHLPCLCGDSGNASLQSNCHLWFLNYAKTIPELCGFKNCSDGLTICATVWPRSAASQGEWGEFGWNIYYREADRKLALVF